MADQYEESEYHEVKDGKEYYIRSKRFRQEAAWAVIAAMECAEPLDTFDRVLIIEREWRRAAMEAEADGG